MQLGFKKGTKMNTDLKLRQERYKYKQRQAALAAVRPETPHELRRRLKPGWDWRKGGRKERDEAKGVK